MRDARKSCLEELAAQGAEQIAALDAGDIDAFNAILDRRSEAIARLEALGDPPEDDDENAALARTIERLNLEAADKLSRMMTDVSQERRALAQNIAGVKAYTKRPIREDGSFIDTMG